VKQVPTLKRRRIEAGRYGDVEINTERGEGREQAETERPTSRRILTD